jgi:hypothetical protein
VLVLDDVDVVGSGVVFVVVVLGAVVGGTGALVVSVADVTVVDVRPSTWMPRPAPHDDAPA